MPIVRPVVFILLLLPFLAAPGAVGRAAAQQDYERPPAGFGDDDAPQGGARYGYGAGGGRDAGGDPGSVSVRVGKLESRIREMTGQIEELQNSNRKLVDQLQRFQSDVEGRLQNRSGSPTPRRSDATGSAGSGLNSSGLNSSGLNGAPMDADPLTPPGRLADAKPLRRGNDAFDPATAPSAPGAPKALGSLASATPPEPGEGPLDLASGRRASASAPPASPSASPLRPAGAAAPTGAAVASLPGSTREEFDAALNLYKDKQYETAEQGFSAFIQKNPKSRLVADATFYLGETFTQRGRAREAAEQYLKFSTDFTGSPRAAEAMLRLGSSLKAIGAKEQACASFTELPHKYPNAPAYVKTGAEREAKRTQC